MTLMNSKAAIPPPPPPLLGREGGEIWVRDLSAHHVNISPCFEWTDNTSLPIPSGHASSTVVTNAAPIGPSVSPNLQMFIAKWWSWSWWWWWVILLLKGSEIQPTHFHASDIIRTRLSLHLVKRLVCTNKVLFEGLWNILVFISSITIHVHRTAIFKTYRYVLRLAQDSCKTLQGFKIFTYNVQLSINEYCSWGKSLTVKLLYDFAQPVT